MRDVGTRPAAARPCMVPSIMRLGALAAALSSLVRRLWSIESRRECRGRERDACPGVAALLSPLTGRAAGADWAVDAGKAAEVVLREEGRLLLLLLLLLAVLLGVA